MINSTEIQTSLSGREAEGEMVAAVDVQTG